MHFYYKVKPTEFNSWNTCVKDCNRGLLTIESVNSLVDDVEKLHILISVLCAPWLVHRSGI